MATVAHHAAGSGIRAVVNPGFAAGAVRTIAVEALKPLDRCAPIPSPARSDRVRLSAERTRRGRGLFTSVAPIVRAPRANS